MKKITDFIVKKRYLFLSLFIVLAGLGLFLSTKVNINEDIMKYLPKTSETKIGKDIMDEAFAKEKSSVLNVMFKGLSESEKNKTLKKLEKIDGVSSVDYENTKEYNKDNKTLYILNVDDYDNSKKATRVYNYVKDNFKTEAMSGSIYDQNKPILQLWIVAIAILFAMIILIILSDSYLEPWLYLISIGIAIFINKGTNIVFDSVSSITNSIVAILQLALSMDYSIMLSNRYKQEKEKNNNKIEAMKEALYQSFKAISSSSVTTIVGLIALVFMSFTIGKDLGFVLAKGVLLSLASIFFCLPALLLIFDDLIAKTKKKTPKFNLTKLGKFIYKTRFIQACLIIVLFVIAYLAKGNINILYTASEQDKVGKVFPTTNQMAIVYSNKYEDVIANYCKELENDKKIDQVLCYSNTINEKLAYDELNKKFKDLGQDVSIEDYLIKIIYYNYYNKDENNKMTLNEFISFIKSDIYTNNNFSDSLDQDMKDSINLLENFTSPSLMNEKRSVSSIANILKMNEDDARNILIYYNSKNLNTTMTVNDFTNFMLNDVAKDSNYSSSIDSSTISKLQKLQNFTDTSIINKKMNSKQLSNIFGIDESKINDLFLFYRLGTPSTTKLTLGEFSNMALKMYQQPEYQNMFDENTVKSLTMLQILTSDNTYNVSDMKQVLGSLNVNIDTETLYSLYIYYTGFNTNKKLSLNEFASSALQMASIKTYESYFEGKIDDLQMLYKLTANYDKILTRDELYDLFNINSLYRSLLNFFIKGDMTPQEFVNTILETVPESYIQSQKADLQKAKYIMSIADKYYTAEEMFTNTNLGLDQASLYFVYGYNQKDNLCNISVKDLIKFLYNNKNSSLLAPYLKDLDATLDQSYKIVSIADNSYSYKEMSNILSNISSTAENNVQMIFASYDYYHEQTSLTPLELANLILDNKDNSLLKDKISSSSINELSLATKAMNSSLKQTAYSPSSLSSLLGINNDTVSLLYGLYDFKYVSANEEISLYNYVDFIIKDVMNNKDYASKFDNEKRQKLTTISAIMNDAIKNVKYTSNEAFNNLSKLSNNLDKSLLELVYMYYGSSNEYDNSWKMTIEEFVSYLNKDIITDSRFNSFLKDDKRTTITNAKSTISKAKELIVSDKYSRVVLNTKYASENKDTYEFVNSLQNKIGNKDDIYVVGNSPMAVEMSKTFNKELNKITILTMIFIFVVVAITFKDLIIPFVLVLIIQTAVYITMSAISLTGGTVYFISLLIVQAILMGATIDYAIVYTSYYRESRLTMNVKDSIINAYNKSIHTIISSSSILIIVTLVVANFASAIAAKICETISQGTFASAILILFLLPGVLATTDKLICKKGYYKEKPKRKQMKNTKKTS